VTQLPDLAQLRGFDPDLENRIRLSA